MVTAVDPDRSGEIIWQKKVGRGGRLGGVQWRGGLAGRLGLHFPAD
jgi:hypothetical protein